nr:angiopoietin-2-like [Anolis sagrei ordinatus]
MGGWWSSGSFFFLVWAGIDLGALGLGLKGKDAAERIQHRVQQGSCTYTFLLPEVGSCDSSAADYQVSNSLQRDAPSVSEAKWPVKRLQQLEDIMENNTQWLQKAPLAMVNGAWEHLSHSCFCKGMSSQGRGERFLERKVLALEGKREEELQGLRSEKLEMQRLLSKQMDFVGHLEQRLGMALLNNTALQKQQTSLAETVKHLIGLVSQCNQISLPSLEEQTTFKDCAAAYKLGFTKSGVYTIRVPNTTETAKVLCDMETSGGGWTVIQLRKDGSVDFQRTWKEYKQGFGSPLGEYWLGNDLIHSLTNQGSYSLRIKLQDWENIEAYALYEHFQVGPEEQNYRLYARKYSGTAGRTSSLSPSGTEFSTKDVDNDRCACKCAQMAGGGWWFDACGPSNLNGIYFPPSPAMMRYNGMKWHYWKGPSHSLKMTSMMIRPVDFRED